jgi:hypothetical protein
MRTILTGRELREWREGLRIPGRRGKRAGGASLRDAEGILGVPRETIRRWELLDTLPEPICVS